LEPSSFRAVWQLQVAEAELNLLVKVRSGHAHS
jgi:hypothetical protein